MAKRAGVYRRMHHDKAVLEEKWTMHSISVVLMLKNPEAMCWLMLHTNLYGARHVESLRIASPFSLVSKHQWKVPPCRIRNAFGQAPILDHVANLHVLNNHGVLCGSQMMMGLKVRVFELGGNLFVPFGRWRGRVPSSMTPVFAYIHAAIDTEQNSYV